MANPKFLVSSQDDRKRSSEKIKEQIKIDILTGEISPGQKLSEVKLCEKYNLSRPPMREILNQLASEGFVDIITNKGAFAVTFSQKFIEDIIFLRSMLYPQAVQWAIERITQDEMDTLEETFEFISFYTPTEDIQKLLIFTEGFDSIIYNATKNRELINLLNKYDLIIKYGKRTTHYPINFADATLHEYTAIMKAFQRHNIGEGIEAARVHALHAMLRVRSID